MKAPGDWSIRSMTMLQWLWRRRLHVCRQWHMFCHILQLTVTSNSRLSYLFLRLNVGLSKGRLTEFSPMHTICYWLVACLSGNPLVLVDMSGPGNTWMGDHLRVGKPSWHVTSHLGQPSLLSLWGTLINLPAFLTGIKQGMFTRVRWQ